MTADPALTAERAAPCKTCRGIGYVGVESAEDDDRCPDCTVWERAPERAMGESERACDHGMWSCFDCGSDNHHTGHRLCQVSNADDGYSITTCSFEERTKPCGIPACGPHPPSSYRSRDDG